MDFKKLFNKAKKTVDDRGGVESLKADANELKDIAKGKGSLGDKAKQAAAALKDPGAPGGEEGKAARAGGGQGGGHASGGTSHGGGHAAGGTGQGGGAGGAAGGEPDQK